MEDSFTFPFVIHSSTIASSELQRCSIMRRSNMIPAYQSFQYKLLYEYEASGYGAHAESRECFSENADKTPLSRLSTGVPYQMLQHDSIIFGLSIDTLL